MKKIVMLCVIIARLNLLSDQGDLIKMFKFPHLQSTQATIIKYENQDRLRYTRSYQYKGVWITRSASFDVKKGAFLALVKRNNNVRVLPKERAMQNFALLREEFECNVILDFANKKDPNENSAQRLKDLQHKKMQLLFMCEVQSQHIYKLTYAQLEEEIGRIKALGLNRNH